MGLGIGKSDKQPEDDDLDARASEQADVEGEAPEETASYDDGPKFRPSYLDEPARDAEPTPMTSASGDTFFVSVVREGAEEIHRFNDPAEAQGFLEGLLADGVQQDDVTAFSGHRLALRVSHRPVVKLINGD